MSAAPQSMLFVDGCFWHGCPRHSNMPANNRAFWMKKLEGNRARDRLVARTLRQAGWRVVRVWEHELRNPRRVVARIRRALGLGIETAEDADITDHRETRTAGRSSIR